MQKFIVDDSFTRNAFQKLHCGVVVYPAVSNVRGGASNLLCYLNRILQQTVGMFYYLSYFLIPEGSL